MKQLTDEWTEIPLNDKYSEHEVEKNFQKIVTVTTAKWYERKYLEIVFTRNLHTCINYMYMYISDMYSSHHKCNTSRTKPYSKKNSCLSGIAEEIAEHTCISRSGCAYQSNCILIVINNVLDISHFLPHILPRYMLFP